MNLHTPKLFVLLVAATMLFCTPSAAQEQARAVPADASMVMRIDVGRILKLADADPLALAQSNIDDLKSVNPVMAEAVAQMLGEPQQAGIDLDSPLFLFVSASQDSKSSCVGMSLRVYDKKRFGAWLDKLSAAGKELDVKRSGKLSYAESGVAGIIFDGDVMALYVNTGNKDMSVKDMRSMFDPKGGGITSNEGFARMSKIRGQIAVMISGSLYGGLNAGKLALMYKNMPLEDMVFTGGVNSSDGKAEISWESVALTPEAERSMAEFTQMLAPIEGRYAGCIPSSSLLTYYVGLRGGAFMHMLKDMLGDEAKGEEIDLIEKLVSSIDGDVAAYAAMPAMEGNSIDFPAALMASVKDRSIMDFIAAKLAESGTEPEKTADGYAVTNNGINIYITERDGTMTVSSMAGADKAVQNPMTADVKGTYAYSHIDAKAILKAVGPFLGLVDSDGSIASLLGRLDSLQSEAPTTHSTRSVVRFTDSGDNLYKFVADAVEVAMKYSAAAQDDDSAQDETEADEGE